MTNGKTTSGYFSKAPATYIKTEDYDGNLPKDHPQALPRPNFLTDKQTAGRYGISRPTIWRWVSEGRFPLPVKLGPAVTRWRLADLERWEQEVGA